MSRDSRSGRQYGRWLADGWPWLLFASLQLPALRPLYKYAPEAARPLIPVALLVAFALYALILNAAPLRGALCRFVDRRWVAPAALVGLIVVVAAVYPLADGLRDVGRGSDADDAVIEGVRQLMRGANPYEARTYLGNPLSPGPGWILLWAPLAATGIYWAISPLSVALAALALRDMAGGRAAALFVLLPATTLAFWELAVVGSDLIAIGCAAVVLLALARRVRQRPAAVGIGVLAGLVATSRVIFFYLPLLLALLEWRRDRRLSLLIGLAGLAVCAALHGAFYLWGPEAYGPIHILAKGGTLLPPALNGIALASCVGVGLVMLRWNADAPERWLFVAWLGVLAPLAWAAFGDLVYRRQWDLATWEGTNYLVVPMPLVAALAALKICERARRDEP